MIAFQSTSIAGASAAASGATAQSAIRDALVNHPSGAWTLVEEFDSAGATVHWVVLKNDKTLSGADVDFFVCIGRVTATGQICTMVGEVYTMATHALSVFAPLSSSTGSGSTSNTILADGSYAAGAGASSAAFTLAASIVPGTQGPVAPTDTAAATMRFVTMVEKDYAIVHVNTTAFYIGALTDLIVPAPGLVAATPIGLFDLFNAGSGAFGALTRHPIDATLAPMQAAYTHTIVSIINNSLVMIARQAFDTALYLNPDRFQGNRVAATEIAAIMAAANTQAVANNTAAKMGALRGKFKNIRMTTFPAAAVLYDTIVVDGRKHIILNDKGLLSGGEFLTPLGYNTQVRWGLVCDTGVAAP